MANSVGFGFRWIDDITVELKGERLDSELQFKIFADSGVKKYSAKKSSGQMFRRVSKERIPCNKTDEIIVELFEKRHDHRFQLGSRKIKITLEDDEIHSKKTYIDASGISVTLEFSYTTGGELREQVEGARIITDQQTAVLDKIKRVHVFFKNLEGICAAIKEVHPYIEGGCKALLLLYKLCERQKECCDAARSLVDDMDDLLIHGVERLGGMLKINSDTRAAFESIVDVVKEVSEHMKKRGRRALGGLRDAILPGPKEEIEELREKFKKAKEGLRDGIYYGTWERVVDKDLRSKLDCVLEAHYSSGEGCLEHTRKSLLTLVDNWVHGSLTEKTAWVHGYAGSGKSALLNSIAENLEDVGIPFICFPCKRDDPQLSDMHRILPAIAYILTEYYGYYRGLISDAVRKPTGRSITTGDVKKQANLLFGEAYGMVLADEYSRPPVYVILIDAFDECRNHRNGDKTAHERRALLEILLNFANTVPWIKVLITSRPEPDVVEAFNDTIHSIRCININDDKWKTSADIRLFVEAKSTELKLGLSLNQVDRFQEKASGLFIWCTTVFRYIEKSKKSKSRTVADVLQDHPSPDSKNNPHAPLYSLYQRVITSAASDARDKELMETILGVVFVVSSRKPLSMAAITDILFPSERGVQLEEQREWVGNVVKSLFAIIYVEEETNAVRACHYSVLDYIGGILGGKLEEVIVKVDGIDKTSTFSTRLEDIHARVFDGCFDVMKSEIRFNICDLEDSFRLNKDVPSLPARIKQNISEALQYGCMFWISHLVESGVKRRGEQVFAFLNSLMALYWIEALSLLDAVDRGIVALQCCANFFAAELNVAGIANEWELFLLAFGDASKSTPHLYLSALSWIPGNSPLWGIIRSSFSSELPMVSNVPEMWKGERWSESVGTIVLSVAYSPDGRLFAAGCEDGSIRFWDARSRKNEREPFMTGSPVLSTTFSPDSHWLASGHDDYKIRLWNLRVDQPVPRVLEGHTNWVWSVAFSSDGKKLVSGSWDESIRVWDAESGAAIGKPSTGHGSHITSVTFSPDETSIISSSWDNTVRIWDVKTGDQLREPLEGHSVACSLDGMLIASGSDNGAIILWDAQTYEQIGKLSGHTGWVNSVRFSFDSKRVASGSDDGSVRIWNVDTRSLMSELKGHTKMVWEVAFSPDGRSVLSSSWDYTVRIWDVKVTGSVNQPSAVSSARMTCVSYVPGSNYIVSGSLDGNLSLWDAHTGETEGWPMQGHSGAVHALAVSSDGRWLVSGSYDNTLRMWDIGSRTPIGKPMLGHTSRINSVAVSPDNQLIASASDDKTVRLWDVATRKAVKTLEGHKSCVTSVTFSVNGNEIISGSGDETIRIWNTRTGEAVGQPLQHSNRVLAVAVSPDGQWIASGSRDETVRIWSSSTLSVIHDLKGHYTWVTSVSFSPDSQFLISGSFDNTARVWNVQTGEAVKDALTGHTRWINSVAFAPDGHEFASASDDGTIRVWNTHVHTDVEMQKDGVTDYGELGEKELLARWSASLAYAANNCSGWIKDQEKSLLWVPWQYRHDTYGGVKLVIAARDSESIRPQASHQKIFKYSGMRWMDIYTGKNT